MKIKMHGLGLIGLLGGLGGAINGWLFRIGAGVSFIPWPVIPLGAFHGALLAILSVGLAALLWEHNPRIRWMGFLITGWLSGWISFIPFALYHYASAWSVFGWEDVWSAFMWPFEGWHKARPIWVPYICFGLVGLVNYFFLNLRRQLTAKKLVRHLIVGCGSGTVGSLWFWITFQAWQFSLIHGMIWGSLVGFGVWKAQRVASERR